MLFVIALLYRSISYIYSRSIVYQLESRVTLYLKEYTNRHEDCIFDIYFDIYFDILFIIYFDDKFHTVSCP